MRHPVAVVVKGYPRLSETFVAQEILALERRGIELVIVSLRRPTDRFTHPIHTEIRSPVLYLPEYLHEAPRRVLRAWKTARRLPGYARARSMWLADLARDRTPNRVRRFGQALVLAAERSRVTSIHAHFLHTPSSVARYASAMLGIGWSFSAHAKDVWTTPGLGEAREARRRPIRGDLHAGPISVTSRRSRRHPIPWSWSTMAWTAGGFRPAWRSGLSATAPIPRIR